MDNYANSLEYKKYIEQFDYIFQKQYFKKVDEIVLNNNYKVLVINYNHTYQIGKNYYKSVSCQVFKLMDNDKVIYQTKAVFGRPFLQYIKHKDNNEYFICGNNLLDFSVYNITKNDEYKYVNEHIINDNYHGYCNNDFWYITEWLYNKNTNFVAINGQDVMNCATVTIGNFIEPEKLLYSFVNLSSLLYRKYNEATCKAIKWLENNNLLVIIGEENSREVIITEDEINKIIKNNGIRGYGT